MAVIAEYGTFLLVLACIFGVFMAWGVGANDVANAMGTSVGSRALTIKQAIVIAMVFEFLGAYLAGGEVTSTIRNGIIDPARLTDSPELLIYGMLSALLAAGTWLLVASVRGWPVSTTHSIVGAIVGFAAVGVGMEYVKWSAVGRIALSWVISPVLAGCVAYGLFRSVQILILDHENPFQRAKRFIPFYMFAVGFFIAMMTLIKGLKHVFSDAGIDLGFGEAAALSAVVGLLVMGTGKILLRNVREEDTPEVGSRFAGVERVFAVLMIFTACSMAFAHGSNDVANAVGPLAAIYSVISSEGVIASQTAIPSWILLLGGLGIVAGLATYGYKVIATIGRKITELTPSRGFAAELGAAGTVVLASGIGVPVSTTHTLVGAILGVGLARGIGALNLSVIGAIFMSWVVTLPVGAVLAIIFFFSFKTIF